MPIPACIVDSLVTGAAFPSAGGLPQAAAPSPDLGVGTREWFALGIKPRHEKVVAHLLEAKGYESFLPVYPQLHRYGKRVREFELALFPGYVFCCFDVLARLPVLTTPGVIRIVGAGRTPLPVDDREIDALRTAIRAQLPVEPHPFLRTGARVRITGGSLAGLEGIVVDFKKSSFRLVLSITLLQRSVLVEIERDLVRPGGDSARCVG